MNVYQCRSCFRIISNYLSFVKSDSYGIVVTGVEDCISLVPTKDPEVYFLKCVCNNVVGEGLEGIADKSRQLTYTLQNNSIIRCLIKKLVGHGRNDSTECENNETITSEVVDIYDDMKTLTTKVEQLQKELTSIKEEKYSEKMETMCAMMGDNMAVLTRMTELICDLHPDMDFKSVFPKVFGFV